MSFQIAPGVHAPGVGKASLLEAASVLVDLPWSDDPLSVDLIVAHVVRRAGATAMPGTDHHDRLTSLLPWLNTTSRSLSHQTDIDVVMASVAALYATCLPEHELDPVLRIVQSPSDKAGVRSTLVTAAIDMLLHDEDISTNPRTQVAMAMWWLEACYRLPAYVSKLWGHLPEDILEGSAIRLTSDPVDAAWTVIDLAFICLTDQQAKQDAMEAFLQAWAQASGETEIRRDLTTEERELLESTVGALPF